MYIQPNNSTPRRCVNSVLSKGTALFPLAAFRTILNGSVWEKAGAVAERQKAKIKPYRRDICGGAGSACRRILYKKRFS
jgi:hypothetical protein